MIAGVHGPVLLYCFLTAYSDRQSGDYTAEAPNSRILTTAGCLALVSASLMAAFAAAMARAASQDVGNAAHIYLTAWLVNPHIRLQLHPLTKAHAQ